MVHYMTNEPYNQLSCQALSPHEPREAPFPTPTPTPNVAHNSPRSVFITTHKRCNSNDPIYMFERFTWELRATLLGNHNVRRPKPQTEKISHIKTPQGPKAPAPHATPPEAAPKRECCTRYGTMHPIRGTAPDQGHCTRSEEVHYLRIGCSTPTHKNKRGTGKPSRSWPTRYPRPNT